MMKKIIALGLCILIVVVLGVGLTIKSQTDLGTNYSCTFPQFTVYGHYQFYYIMSGNENFVYAPFGIYKQKPEKDGWMLRLFLEKYENSVHAGYTTWIHQRKMGTGERIECTKLNSIDEFPSDFKTFIEGHRLIIKANLPDVKELDPDLKNNTENILAQ